MNLIAPDLAGSYNPTFELLTNETKSLNQNFTVKMKVVDKGPIK